MRLSQVPNVGDSQLRGTGPNESGIISVFGSRIGSAQQGTDTLVTSAFGNLRSSSNNQKVSGSNLQANASSSRIYRPLDGQVMIKNLDKIEQKPGRSIMNQLSDEQPMQQQKQNEFQFKIKDMQIAKKKFIDETLPDKGQLLIGFNKRPIVWKRLSEMYKEGTPLFSENTQSGKADELTTGMLESASLLTCLEFCSKQKLLLLRLFESKIVNSQGIYSVWLFNTGVWQNVIIDDFVPIYSDNGVEKHAFCCEKNAKDGGLWVVILEKCYAKMYKGYVNITTAPVHEILHDLTGAQYQIIELAGQIEESINDRQKRLEAVWIEISSTLSNAPLSAITVQAKTLGFGDIQYQSYFVVRTYQLALSDSTSFLKAVLLKNKSVRVASIFRMDLIRPDQRAQLEKDIQAEGQGVFVVSFEQFVESFRKLIIMSFYDNICFNSILTHHQTKSESTACFIRINVTNPTNGIIQFCQTDIRLRSESLSEPQYSPISGILAQILPNGDFRSIVNFENVGKVCFVPFSLSTGIYVLFTQVSWIQSCSSKSRELVLSVSSERHLQLQEYRSTSTLEQLLPKVMLKYFVQQKGIQIFPDQRYQKVHRGESGPFFAYVVKNDTDKFILKQSVEVTNSQGFEILDNSLLENGNTINYQLFPQEEIIIAFRQKQRPDRDLRIQLQFLQGSKLLFKQNKEKQRDQRTIQYQLSGIDYFGIISALEDRKATFITSQFFRISNQQSKKDQQEEEEDEEEDEDEDEESKQNHAIQQDSTKFNKVQQPPSKNVIFIQKFTAFLNIFLVAIVIISSLLKSRNAEFVVYVFVLIKMLKKNVSQREAGYIAVVLAVSPVVDVYEARLEKNIYKKLFSSILDANSNFSSAETTISILDNMIIVLKLIFLFLMIRFAIVRRKEGKYYYQEFEVLSTHQMKQPVTSLIFLRRP